MALNAKKIKGKPSGPSQPNLEPGTYPGRLVQIIDYGLQPQRPYQGQEKPPAYEIGLTYELVDEFMLDEEGNPMEDKPRWISETIPLHNLRSEKARSTARYHAFDPDEVHEGDWTALAGEPANITIVNNKSGDRVYDNVGNVTSMRPRDAKNTPPLVNETRILSLDDDNVELFLSLPEWIQDKIKDGLEWESTNLYKALQRQKGSSDTKGSQKEEKPVSEAPKRSKRVVEEDEGDEIDSIPFDADGKVEDNENW